MLGCNPTPAPHLDNWECEDGMSEKSQIPGDAVGEAEPREPGLEIDS